jgi:SAM-dependent methyltransferase
MALWWKLREMMSRRTDPEYLKKDQYVDAGNLNARIELHLRFSTNPQDWFRWVFDRLDLSGTVKVLELGCGPGLLWKHNLDRLSSNYQVILSDFSSGMIHEARLNTHASTCPIIFTLLDAQAIPFPTAYFHLVIANICSTIFQIARRLSLKYTAS